jgi:hypothetical protein
MHLVLDLLLVLNVRGDMFWGGSPLSALLRHSARTHRRSFPSAHKCRQGLARPLVKDAFFIPHMRHLTAMVS